MNSKLRFRHIFPEVQKEKFEQIRVATANSDTGLIKGNGKYIAFAWQAGGGGSLAVLPADKPSRLPPTIPLIKGHTGAIQDLDFYPFHDNMIATASDDTTVRVWNIPEEFTEDVTEPLATLQGHGKRVSFVNYHPTASHVLASASMDANIKIWDIERQAATATLTAPEAYFSLNWNYNGSLLGVTTRDKTARIGDPRSQSWVGDVNPHDGPKAQKFCWLGETGLAPTCGFAKSFEREFKVWDTRNFKDPVQTVRMDSQASVIYPFYDADLGVLYLGGRGDGNIRYFEFSEGQFHYLSDHKSTTPQKGIGFVPKRAVNVMKNELMRCVKLTDNYVEFISFIQPRKAESFQEDLFPDCVSDQPAQTAEEWISGKDENPIRRSMRPSESNNNQKQQSKVSLNLSAPTQQSNTTNNNNSAELSDVKNQLSTSEQENQTLKKQLQASQDQVQNLTEENESLRRQLEELKVNQTLVNTQANSQPEEHDNQQQESNNQHEESNE